MPFPYKTVLVTGATSGIGQALVERMLTAGDGIFVIAVGRRQDRLDALQARFGADRVAVENVDVGDLASLPAWTAKITAAYPALDCVVLNAGFQQALDFSDPQSVINVLPDLTSEITVNYLSPVHAAALFLPHLTSRGPGKPAALVFVTSGLALVPIARCPNYCASKAALHSLAWTLRSQLQDSAAAAATPPDDVVRVIEIIPPAVQTELHTRQGQAKIGLPLDQFIDETWAGLTAAEPIDEIMPQILRDMSGHVEDAKRESYKRMGDMLKKLAAQSKDSH
ncbi:hypothetical protein SCUCBS95973_001519 [Sporothrix curviconia]|uniref:Ketoreductase domain-containing protein n=1 Tax=Sporothrix curviconia TaxID=1260050 RepID=A0ABP0AZU8_9PEZI